MLFSQFRQHWKKQFSHLSTTHCRLLLAVSGGVDSVVLVDLVHEAGFSYEIAHVNFQLRGEESMRDENFVRSLGGRYGKETLVKQFDTRSYAADRKISIQEAARDLRYGWFEEIINGWSRETTNYILTAHHADDNIETVLMHFFRGTGIQGLAGIRPVAPERNLLRPLLPFKKKELLAYAEEEELAFVEDSSNASDKYTRNFFRNQLLPQIREIFPQVEENLAHNIERFREITALYRQSVDWHLHHLLEKKNSEYHIPVLKWKKAYPLYTITWELIKTFGFQATQTEEVIRLLDAANGSYQSSPTHRIIRNRNWMIISPLSNEASQHILIEKATGETRFAEGSLVFGNARLKIQKDPAQAFINADALQFPLLLRKWKTGDYFYPFGMQKKKKLSRFFIDLKLSKTDKEKVWVLESDKKIVWVIGHRIDNRFRVTEQTQNTLHIRFKTGAHIP